MFLIREALEAAQVKAEVQIVPDGEKAIQLFERFDRESLPCPELVILDLNLPKRPGREVLQHVRQTRQCAEVRVLVVTSSNSDRDRDEMAKFAVSGYFRKPSEYAEFMKLGGVVKSLLGPAAEPGLPQ